MDWQISGVLPDSTQTRLGEIQNSLRSGGISGRKTGRAIPRKPSRLKASLLAILCIAFAGALRAQPIIYVGQNPTTSLGELRVMNSDGTGSRTLPVPVVEAGFPSMSRNGRLLALTAQTPGRPNQFSRNVFVFDMLTAQLSQITSFQDTVDAGSHTFTLPWYHAISPDLSTIAVWDFVESGVVSNETTTPVLQTFRLSDGFLVDTKFINRQLTGFTQGGDGVDWSPTQDLLVYAADADIPLFDYTTGQPLGTVGEGTALFLVPGSQSGASQQITFPIGRDYSSLTRIYITGQADYAPVFSPNGQQVAFVRATYIQDTFAPNYRQASILELHMVNTNGSNDHLVLALNQGAYVTHLSWSRDGTQLVFDSGNQLFVNGSPVNSVDPATDALWIVSTNGTGLRPLRGTISGFPVWTPAGTTFCNLPGVTAGGGTPGTIDDCGPPLQLKAVPLPAGQMRLDVTGGTDNLLYRVLGSTDLANWQTLGTFLRTNMTTSFIDTSAANRDRLFYRVTAGN